MSKRFLYSLALLGMKAPKDRKLDMELIASVVLAHSLADARAKGRGQAQQLFPESKGFITFRIEATEICSEDEFKEGIELQILDERA